LGGQVQADEGPLQAFICVPQGLEGGPRCRRRKACTKPTIKGGDPAASGFFGLLKGSPSNPAATIPDELAGPEPGGNGHENHCSANDQVERAAIDMVGLGQDSPGPARSLEASSTAALASVPLKTEPMLPCRQQGLIQIDRGNAAAVLAPHRPCPPGIAGSAASGRISLTNRADRFLSLCPVIPAGRLCGISGSRGLPELASPQHLAEFASRFEVEHQFGLVTVGRSTRETIYARRALLGCLLQSQIFSLLETDG